MLRTINTSIVMIFDKGADSIIQAALEEYLTRIALLTSESCSKYSEYTIFFYKNLTFFFCFSFNMNILNSSMTMKTILGFFFQLPKLYDYVIRNVVSEGDQEYS